MWDEILAEPIEADTDLYATSVATAHYARGIAYASMGLIAEAEQEQVGPLLRLQNLGLLYVHVERTTESNIKTGRSLWNVRRYS